MRLKGKRALVTGGSRGIGRAIVEAFAKEGADVAVNYVRDDKSALEAVKAAEACGGAALDVFEEEPLPANHPLRDCGNVILTPHAAYYSESSLTALQRQAAEEVARFLLDCL